MTWLEFLTSLGYHINCLSFVGYACLYSASGAQPLLVIMMINAAAILLTEDRSHI